MFKKSSSEGSCRQTLKTASRRICKTPSTLYALVSEDQQTCTSIFVI